MKIGIVGGGTMGAAFATCLIEKSIANPADIVILENDLVRRENLEGTLHCQVLASADSSLGGCDAIVLCVKPQDFKDFSTGFEGELVGKAPLVISFMAGIRLENISRLLGGQKSVVRVMPNLPISIAQGMSVYICTDGVSPSQRTVARTLLNACGLSLEVRDEKLLDAATAISGTGPGYVFYFIDHLLSAARDLGFSEAEAKQIIGQTLVGSIELWRQGAHTALELRKLVTSKNGTTEAAVQVFEKGELGKIMIAGIKRAEERARELAALADKS